MWRRGVVVITTAQLPSTKPELMLTVCWRFAMVRISSSGPGWKQGVNAFFQSTVPQNQFIIVTSSIEATKEASETAKTKATEATDFIRSKFAAKKIISSKIKPVSEPEPSPEIQIHTNNKINKYPT